MNKNRLKIHVCICTYLILADDYVHILIFMHIAYIYVICITLSNVTRNLIKKKLN